MLALIEICRKRLDLIKKTVFPLAFSYFVSACTFFTLHFVKQKEKHLNVSEFGSY